jgi:NTE family protein
MVYGINGKYIRETPTKVAIACQGGGAQTAFTAGVLSKILEHNAELKEKKGIEIVGFSGTSGGAICSALAWYGLLKDYAIGNSETSTAIKWLKDFWDDNSVKNFIGSKEIIEANPWYSWFTNSIFFNQMVVQGGRNSHELGMFVEFNPYLYPEYVKKGLKKLLAPYKNFQNAQKWKNAIHEKDKRKGDKSKITIPFLIVGAANVKTGKFGVFNSDFIDIDDDILMASGAIPTMVKAVEINDNIYWDGLYSQNPPLRDLLGFHEESIFEKKYHKNFDYIKEDFHDKKPDEIWIIRINPKECYSEPKSLLRIKDRQNELSGNLSLEQEIYFINKINELLPHLTNNKYNYIKMEHNKVPLEIEINEEKLGMSLDLESKLNRDPDFINNLREHGEEQADEFILNVLNR